MYKTTAMDERVTNGQTKKGKQASHANPGRRKKRVSSFSPFQPSPSPFYPKNRLLRFMWTRPCVVISANPSTSLSCESDAAFVSRARVGRGIILGKFGVVKSQSNESTVWEKKRISRR
ncbi:hypothetical protein CPC08DRAFT_364756 [Agrocybe pediades]|nr:hypothetical protein CPC08DRAFT_364756 [Agrocybe pediades]